jgi:hypothetical protein
MKPQELRIGNYVYDCENYIDEITSIIVSNKDTNQWLSFIKDGDLGVTIFLKNFNAPIHIDNLAFIPLTEEWLLKFEADLFPWGWVLFGFLIRWNMKDKFWIEIGNGKIIELPYVHTLQNFMSLTGKELEL